MKSKAENRKLRSMQRTVEAKFAYKCIIAYHKYTYVTNCGVTLSAGKKKLRYKKKGGAAHLVIRQQRRLTLARETLGELLESRIVLDKVAIVVHVSVRRSRVSLKFGRIGAPVRRVHDVLVHREVVAPSVPEPVPQLATVCSPRRLGLLLRGQRKTRIAPFLWGCRERV
jgi:hypothetical protein